MIQAMAMQFRYSCEYCNENLGLIYYINLYIVSSVLFDYWHSFQFIERF